MPTALRSEVLDVTRCASGFRGATARWERLSFIGQTYGAASTILAVLALIGVVVTLVLQAHETRLAREEARRAAIGDLLRMAMDDPDLDECWGPISAGQDLRRRRQQMYVNMILSEWQMSFETRALGERRLRAISREMFEGRVGREFWVSAREIRLSTSETRRARRFHQILDEEYQRAPEPPGRAARTLHRRWPMAAGTTGALGAGTPDHRCRVERLRRAEMMRQATTMTPRVRTTTSRGTTVGDRPELHTGFESEPVELTQQPCNLETSR